MAGRAYIAALSDMPTTAVREKTTAVGEKTTTAVGEKTTTAVGENLTAIGENAVLVEPWRLISHATRPLEERVALARAFPRISHRTAAPLGPAPLTAVEELEIGLQYMVWMGAALLPLVAAVWLCVSPTPPSLIFAAGVCASMVWPNRSWAVPPATRMAMPLRNRKVASAFIRYFPMRCIVEDDSIFEAKHPSLFAGVPHGLFPIGFVLLGFCNFVLPWRRIRAAAASVTLRLPVWRQVSLWNDGIDVSRKAITSALRKGDNVLVAMDGACLRVSIPRPLGHGAALATRTLVSLPLTHGVDTRARRSPACLRGNDCRYELTTSRRAVQPAILEKSHIRTPLKQGGASPRQGDLFAEAAAWAGSDCATNRHTARAVCLLRKFTRGQACHRWFRCHGGRIALARHLHHLPRGQIFPPGAETRARDDCHRVTALAGLCSCWRAD